jgi:hypothetical protein
MRGMSSLLWKSARQMIPKGKYRWQLILLVIIAAAIPVTELLVAKLFTDLVVSGSGKSAAEITTSVVLFALLFATTRVANYVQKTYRVKFFDKSFGANERTTTANAASWAMALELVNVLSFITQMMVIATFFFFLDLTFAAINLAFLLVLLQVIGVLFVRQFKTQRSFVQKRRAKEVVTPAERLGARIQQAEFGTLLASAGVVVLFVLLIVLSINGAISLANTIVLFLGLRLQNTTFSSVSSSLMRFARAKAQSF